MIYENGAQNAAPFLFFKSVAMQEVTGNKGSRTYGRWHFAFSLTRSAFFRKFTKNLLYEKNNIGALPAGSGSLFMGAG